MAESAGPVRIAALQDTTAATTAWRARGQLNVTVVVKATFALSPGGAMSVVAPEPIVRSDQHHRGDPAASVRVASELGPYLTRAEVTLAGHAYAPRGRPVPVQAVRLAVYRGAPLLDKTLYVYGDRRDGAPQPFDRLPLVYEHTFGGPGWDVNPVGVGALEGRDAATSAASIVSPTAPGQSAGFGPIARSWPARRRLLGRTDPAVLDQPIAELPDGFDWKFFQSAPPDQWIDDLQGEEWIVLDGMHPDHPRLQSHLPGAHAAARVYGLTPAAPGMARPIALRADMLHIDADTLRCTLVWRGTIPVRDEAALDALDVVAGVELPGRPIPWPDVPPASLRSGPASTPQAPVAPVAPAPAAASHPLDGTMGIDEEDFVEEVDDVEDDDDDDELTPPRHSVPAALAAAPAAAPPAPQPPAAPLWTATPGRVASLGDLSAAPKKGPPVRDNPLEGTVMADDDAPGERPAIPFGAAPPAPPRPPASSPGRLLPSPSKDNPLEGTMMADDDSPAARPALPFARGAPPAPPPPPSALRRPPPPAREHPLTGTMGVEEDAPGEHAALPFGARAVAPQTPPQSSPGRLLPLPPPPREESPLEGTMALDEDGPHVTLPFVAAGDAPLESLVASPGRFTAAPARNHALTDTLDGGEVAPAPHAPLPFPGAEPPPSQRSSSLPEASERPPAAPQPTATPASAAPFYHRIERPLESGARAVLPRIEPRRADAIPVVTRTPLLAFTLPWETKPGQPARVVVVKATFDLVPGAPARLRAETEPPSGDVHAGDDTAKSLLYPSDFAPFKPGVDVTLKGHAYAPGGGAPTGLARFRFGRPRAAAGKGFDRSIAVFGERRWQPSMVKTTSTEPRRFDRIPLVYEHAYGGPGFDRNPAGTGHGAAGRLPNLEDPAHLVKSPGDTPEPAGFGAVPMLWPARWGKLGTYDGDWLETRWPHFPEDFDWRFFQAAPPSQQLEHVEGDEPFELVGVCADHPRLQGWLPRLRPRCFALETTRALEEIVLRLDTVTFDADELKLTLVWRGLLEVADDAATELVELFLMTEPLAGPHLTPAEVAASHEVARQKLSLLEEEPDAPGPANQTAPEAPLGAYEKQLREKLRAAGVIEDAPAAAAAAVMAPPPPPSPPEAPQEPAPPAPRPPAHLDPDRARAVQLLAGEGPLDGENFTGADLSDLDFSGRSLVGAKLGHARLVRCRFAGADLAAAQLGGADLTDAVLDGAGLVGTDFTGAHLEAASFVGADVLAASFSGARGERAVFREAHGAQVSFAEGTWTRAHFERAELASADFSKAALDEAVFDGAVLPKIRLYEAHGTRVSFKDATLSEARADGVRLLKSSLQGLSAEGSVWDGATLDESSFQGAALKASSFAKASCQRAVFAGADLGEGRLGRAKLMGASFLKTNLMAASLEAADLTGADLRGANLHGAETWKAKLKGAQLDLALVTQTKLEDK